MKKLILLLIMFENYFCFSQGLNHNWWQYQNSSTPFSAQSEVLTASYFGDTCFLVAGKDFAMYYNNGTITQSSCPTIPGQVFPCNLGSTANGFSIVKASDVYEPKCWAFISNVYKIWQSGDTSLNGHKYFFTADGWGSWIGCNALDDIIKQKETLLGHGLEVVDMKLFNGAVIAAANDTTCSPRRGYLFYANYPGTSYCSQYATSCQINLSGYGSTIADPIKKICVFQQHLWIITENSHVIYAYNTTTWDVSGSSINYGGIDNNSDFSGDELNDIDALNRDTIGVVTDTMVYISYNHGANFYQVTVDVSFKDLASFRFRHYRNIDLSANLDRISATAAGAYTWHTEVTDPFTWFIEMGGLPTNGFNSRYKSIVRYNENNNELLFNYRDAYMRPQYCYWDFDGNSQLISFWGNPDNYPNFFNITGLSYPPLDANTLSAIPGAFDPKIPVLVTSNAPVRLECWLYGFEPGNYQFNNPSGYYIHPNIRAGATTTSNAGNEGYVPYISQGVFICSSDYFIQPQESQQVYSFIPWRFTPPFNWLIDYNDIRGNQIFKQCFNIENDKSCPWTIIPFDVSHHGDSLKIFNYYVPPYSPISPIHFCGNYLGLPGDWFGLFVNDTCVAAQQIKINQVGPYNMTIPVWFNPDSFKIKWEFVNYNYESSGDYVMNNMNHQQFELGISPYPYAGFIPDSFPPLYVNAQNCVVFKHVFYYGSPYMFPNDSTSLFISNDTIISDSVVIGYYDPINYTYNPDTSDCNIHTKLIFRRVVFLNDIAEVGNDKIVITPNPANNYLNIIGTENPEVEIFSLTGQSIFKTKGNHVNIELLSNGMYLCKVKDKNFKFMIIK